MKAKVRKIGNSFGIIIGKKLLEQAEVKEEVSLSIEDSKIIIEAVKSNPRAGWEEMLLKAKSLEDTEFLEDFENEFDKTEWTW
ncbi:AbrB/MazE/SpoVT family DNA-binding domain-containing protein [Elizabethkingia argentiflava]|uniref:AbrB/MazE/SpoVT family DNA-binding domain-containing protein n=1 Tax=Elizabethkingia argenteiflava TaxID=2681556 RepID=A0A845PU31_9FLAO|nr:AbrB/MazE/SpoVT family DNA-binding domain-containing protein [Elizabethkingia argenteiflava]NAW49987.1 AbrB/MazE/SpoVT family DNA-binding domain-containing protein [Elizabethkingia argenteiflava]